MRLTPERADKFAFGLWTIGNLGRDAFGESTREPVDPAEFVRRLSDIGAWGWEDPISRSRLFESF